jgi:FkbM family methyltransferase
MLENLRHRTTALAQRGLAIDALHRKVDVALGKLECLEPLSPLINQLAYTINDAAPRVTAISNRVGTLCELVDDLHTRARRTEDELRKLQEHFDRLRLLVKSFDERLSEQFKSFDEQFQERMAISEPWLPEEDFVHSEPEYYLAAFLYSFLPTRTLLDAGANVGDFAEFVSDSGYQVYAFEPFPATFERLKARMAERGNVKTFNLALGSKETTLPLYIASESSEARQDAPSLYNTFPPHFVRESLAFAETVDVPVRTIESLVKSGELPEQIGFLKVDTEGFDLEVVKGLGDVRPPVVQTEFWGDDFPFVRHEKNREDFVSSNEIIREMRSRNYFWNIIVFRIEAESCVRFGTNLASAPKKAWGNMLFFHDRNLFLEALRWCQAALPQFQAPAPAKIGASSDLPAKAQAQPSDAPIQS